MANTNNQKRSGGTKKHGRSKRAKDTALSAYVRGRTTAQRYFKAHGLTSHFAYARQVFNFKK